MFKIAWHPIYTHPLPEGHRFPMLKYELIPAQLLHQGIIASEDLFSAEPASAEAVLAAHDNHYWEQLRDLTLPPREQRRIGFPLSAQLVERELRIAKGTIEGALHAIKDGVAFNVAGGTHHAGSFWGEGFCLLNDQAIAAHYLLKEKLVSRILIIDLDVHQGNGTAEIFTNEKRVFTFSMHGDKNFPFRKEQSDWDIPLPDGIGDAAYLAQLQTALSKLFTLQQPDFVFYLAGVDVLESDKLGKLALTPTGCALRDELVLTTCKRANVPVQVSMGGGYSPQIRDIVDAHCRTFNIARDIFA